MHEIEAVIFDLGRVLVQVDFSRGLLRYFAGENRGSDHEILEKAFRDPLFKRFSKGKMAPRAFYKTVVQRYSTEISYDEFKKQWCNIFAPMEGMEEIVRHISSRYPVGLLSDIDILHWEYLSQHYTILNYFEMPVLSFKIGAMKPASICYQLAAESVGKAPQACLFIDDRPLNIYGAQRTGMKSIHFKSVSELKQRLSALRIID